MDNELSLLSKEFSVTVRRATVRMGAVRNRLQLEAMATKGEAFEDAWMRRFLYPAIVAGTVQAEGFDTWPISFDEFLDLDEQFAQEWGEAIFKLNPHWSINLGDDVGKAEKKTEPTQTNSTGD